MVFIRRVQAKGSAVFIQIAAVQRHHAASIVRRHPAGQVTRLLQDPGLPLFACRRQGEGRVHQGVQRGHLLIHIGGGGGGRDGQVVSSIDHHHLAEHTVAAEAPEAAAPELVAVALVPIVARGRVAV
ncbi:hypothetical protein SDC9_210756 [bioreactor metagenome]|uniref:Uncharacterized protein n=1 Tax=bioreactor metagenome TaxID=1076179 RepID=A0A645JIF8_9ZZZZ